jgi:hypothetical protein
MKIGDKVILSAYMSIPNSPKLTKEKDTTDQAYSKEVRLEGRVLFVDENRINVEYTNPITGRLERMNKHRAELKRISPPVFRRELLSYISNIRKEIMETVPNLNRIDYNLYLLEKGITRSNTII